MTFSHKTESPRIAKAIMPWTKPSNIWNGRLTILVGIRLSGECAMPATDSLQSEPCAALRCASLVVLMGSMLWLGQGLLARRADEIVRSLREALAKYKDYRMALADGYEPAHPKVPQPHYHFTSKKRGFTAAFRFDPVEPTSLLYKKTASGYELEGAMYTARKGMSEDRLNERVPLSVAQWHAHINICLPPGGLTRRGDWKKFGFKGAIATEQECQQAGGRFFPQIYGWMLHVYPFEQSPEKIWTH